MANIAALLQHLTHFKSYLFRRIARCMTTAVGVGPADADTFAGFRAYVIEASDTHLFAQLTIAAQGMLNAEIRELDSSFACRSLCLCGE